MPTTQRPYLGNFLAAFRAHSTPLPTAPSSSIASTAAAKWTSAAAVAAAASGHHQPLSKQPSTTTSEPNTTSTPRPINPKTTAAPTPTSATATTAAASPTSTTSHPPLQHNVTPQTHLPRSPPSPGLSSVYGPNPTSSTPLQAPYYPTAQEVRHSRRGSNDSSDSGGGGPYTSGFREVRAGGEKWFIGGLTASGEERYYKLSMVKRDRSLDRISTDQLSL